MISCLINGLDSAASVTWSDVSENNQISPNATGYYDIDNGKTNFSGGSQTTRLTLKLPVVSQIKSARTYRCSMSSTHFPGSGNFGADIVVTPISEFAVSDAMKSKYLSCYLEVCSFLTELMCRMYKAKCLF